MKGSNIFFTSCSLVSVLRLPTNSLNRVENSFSFSGLLEDFGSVELEQSRLRVIFRPFIITILARALTVAMLVAVVVPTASAFVIESSSSSSSSLPAILMVMPVGGTGIAIFWRNSTDSGFGIIAFVCGRVEHDLLAGVDGDVTVIRHGDSIRGAFLRLNIRHGYNFDVSSKKRNNGLSSVELMRKFSSPKRRDVAAWNNQPATDDGPLLISFNGKWFQKKQLLPFCVECVMEEKLYFADVWKKKAKMLCKMAENDPELAMNELFIELVLLCNEAHLVGPDSAECRHRNTLSPLLLTSYAAYADWKWVRLGERELGWVDFETKSRERAREPREIVSNFFTK